MTSGEIRDKFFKYFESHGHKKVPSSSLLPTDPSVLFTTAGMQQFKPYYTGQADAMKDFGSLSAVSVQKCVRTSDIDEVGDNAHLTFFEMMGNFSFGGYFKKEAIQYGYEFITQELGLKIDYVSIFGGDGELPADEESAEIWESIDPAIEIKRTGRNETFWGPTGEEGPCGPTTEIYVNGVEIWNIVFNQYFQHKDKALEPLKTPGIDTGMGLDRLVTMAQGKKNVYETDLMEPIFTLLPENTIDEKIKRIVADHSRAIAFLVCDGIIPSNKEQGYVLRRLMRRVIVYLQTSGIEDETVNDIFKQIELDYKKYYPELESSKIIAEFQKEKEKFQKTLKKGLVEMEKIKILDAQSAFKLYESYGLPYEIIKEFGGEKSSGLTQENFEEEFKKHQELSRAGAEKKFGGHGIIRGDLTAGSEEEMEKKIRLHTATHLLQAALRKVLGNEVSQAGSDITAERLRFDFNFPRKMTEDEILAVEKLVNDVIAGKLPVTKEEMPFDEAVKSNALAFFKIKYPPVVNVYSVGDPSSGSGQVFSREVCGGPHVSNTSELGHFKIAKEEAVSAGVRRIRAVLD